jgi:peptidoglycan/LPS O-acetylase OafA/YrhL
MTRARLADLDGLRALAILAVILYQVVRFALPLPFVHPVLLRAGLDASQGLTLFLTLSGFGLAYPLLVTLRSEGRASLEIGAFLVDRALRIYPAYLVALLLTLVIPDVAGHYELPGLAAVQPVVTAGSFAGNALFLGHGAQNDGFRALALIARWYLIFPFVLLAWTRGPIAAALGAAIAAIADLVTPLHAWGIGALVPLLLGIVAADLRVGKHPITRYGMLFALAAAAVAFLIEPFTAVWPGALSDPFALRIDPFWALAAFGIVAGCNGVRAIERALSWRGLRWLADASFSISLVVMPVAAFALRPPAGRFGTFGALVSAALLCLCFGVVLWQLVDRWFEPPQLRHALARRAGPTVDRALAFLRFERLRLYEPLTLDGAASEGGGAPVALPRPEPGSLTVVSTHTGSPEDLEAEILATKRRMAERTSLAPQSALTSEVPPVAMPSASAEMPTIDPPLGPVSDPPAEPPAGPPYESPIIDPPIEQPVIEPVIEAIAIVAAAPIEVPLPALPPLRGPITLRIGANRTASNGTAVERLRADDADG